MRRGCGGYGVLGGAHVFRWFFCGGPPWDGHHFFCAAAAARGGCTASPPTHRRFYCLGAGLLVAPARGGAPGGSGRTASRSLLACVSARTYKANNSLVSVLSTTSIFLIDRPPARWRIRHHAPSCMARCRVPPGPSGRQIPTPRRWRKWVPDATCCSLLPTGSPATTPTPTRTASTVKRPHPH